MKFALPILTACVAILSAVGSAGTLPLRWEPLGEPGCGGAIVSLAVSPHNPRHLVSDGDMLGTAVSFDGGESWQPGMGLPAYEMAAPTFHPTRTNEVWIGSCMGPFVSRDGGLSWQGRRQGMPAPSPWQYTAMIEKVLICRASPNRLLAFGGSSRRWGTCETMGAIWRSETDGESWRRLGTITADGFTTNALNGANIVKAWWGAESTPTAHLFAEGAGWFSSSDDGLTWRKREVRGLSGALTRITTHPTDPRIVWAVAAPARDLPGAIYRSTDGGATFAPSDAGVVKTADRDANLVTHFDEIEVSPVPPHRLYVSDLCWRSDAIWVSDDGGATWRKGCSKATIRTACFAGTGCRIAASPTEADVAYAYNSEYVLKTTDGGHTWTDSTAFAPDPSRPDNWRGRGWNGWCARTVVFNPYRKGQSVIQAMDAARGWVSDDGLRTWHYALGDTNPWGGGKGCIFSKDGFIYLTTGQGGRNNGIVVSRDGGASFIARSGAGCGLPETDAGEYGGVWANPEDGRRAFAVFGDALYRTADGGESWQRDESVTMTGRFAVDPTNPTRFYLRNEKGVFSTEDWKSFRFLGLPGESEGGIACDSVGRVLVCRGRTGDTETRGLWRFDPKTASWTRLHADSLAASVAADPTDPRRLILTTADNPYHDFAGGHGIWRSSDDGRTWQPTNEGLHIRRVTCVAFDPFDPELVVAGTTGGGFVKMRWPKD